MSNITYEWVRGQILVARTDGGDADTEPDLIPAQGTVRFVASVPYLPVPVGSPNPVTVLPEDRVAVFDAAGFLATPEEGTTAAAYQGMRLETSDDPDVSVQGWTWNVVYNITNSSKKIESHNFVLNAGQPVDLSTVVKVPSSTGIGTEQAEALAASAQAAAVSAAQDAATAAQAAVDAADAAQVTDANISALVGNPATDTADAVTALVDAAAADKLNVDDAVGIYQSQASLDAAAAAKVGTGGTSLNGAVKAIADTSAATAAAPKLDASTAATTYAAKSVETSKLDASQKGAASGVASLDAGSRVPLAQVPDLSSRHAPLWTPSTAYTAGQAVVNPSGDLVTAKAAFTSGATYSAANWNLSASFVQWIAGHIGIEKSNPVNARFYIGSGTGSLTDVPTMGIKVKIDSPTDGTGRAPDGIQSNVNLLNGAQDGASRAMIARLDFGDAGSSNSGAGVALWADAWITSASNRNAWGGNIYFSIKPGVAYAKTPIGLEVGGESYGTVETNGGGLHIVGKSTGSKMAFGLMISSDPVADGTPGAIAGAFRTHLLMRTANAPGDNYIWVGPTVPNINIPTGTPLYQMDATGKVGIGAVADSTALLNIGGRAKVGNGTEAGDAVNKGQLDGSAARYAPTGALATTMDRRVVSGSSITALTSGTMRLSAVWLPKGAVVSSITYLSGAVPVGLTNRWFALLDGSRNLLRTTADNTAAWSAGATLTLNLSSTYTVPADGLYYLGFCEVATTVTALRGLASSSNSATIAPVLNGDGAASLTNAASTPATSPAITAQGGIPFAYAS